MEYFIAMMLLGVWALVFLERKHRREIDELEEKYRKKLAEECPGGYGVPDNWEGK